MMFYEFNSISLKFYSVTVQREIVYNFISDVIKLELFGELFELSKVGGEQKRITEKQAPCPRKDTVKTKII